ncbi:hypothetical protein [Bordetella tumulicola]|uniref:hypothetical protein n=1 Tax=Bordetella tumulicola TaxID=1649133 RepID=UPI0039EF422F
MAGTLENAANIRILRSLQQRGTPVRIGVLPFLAEGDQVEIAAYADGISGSESRRAVYAMRVCLVGCLGIALPLLFLDARWRLGRPTRRQRTLERVYLTLDLGTPFAPTSRIEEV